jgi:hypothetical protein
MSWAELETRPEGFFGFDLMSLDYLTNLHTMALWSSSFLDQSASMQYVVLAVFYSPSLDLE